jgi:hypothetical protein
MSEAFESALKELQDTGQLVVTEVIASRIIAAAKLVRRDPIRLREAALNQRGQPSLSLGDGAALREQIGRDHRAGVRLRRTLRPAQDVGAFLHCKSL